MALNTYPNLTGFTSWSGDPTRRPLTNASTDTELIRLWISQKSRTTQKTYITISRQFLTFAGKELAEVKLEDILLWLESFQLRGKSQNMINNKLAESSPCLALGLILVIYRLTLHR